MSKEDENNESYRDGVKAGQNDDFLQSAIYKMTKGTSEQDEIYDKGYEWGQSHPNSDSDSDSDDDSSGCFITTACMKYKGLPDDCYELQTLRKFRNNFLLQTDEGKLLVKDYYEIAPRILLAIDKNDSSVWETVYNQIEEIVNLIGSNCNFEAIEKYKEMVYNLPRS